MSRFRAIFSNSFVRFVVTGGLAAAVNISSRVLLSMVVSFEIAVAVAFLFGMVTAYVLARKYVFKGSGQTVRSEFVRFAAVNLVSLVQVWLISIGLANWLFPATGFTWHAEFIAHTVGVISPIATSYFGHKLFTFKPVVH